MEEAREKKRRNKPALCGREQKDDMTKNGLWRVRRRSRDKEVRVLVVAVPPGAVRGNGEPLGAGRVGERFSVVRLRGGTCLSRALGCRIQCPFAWPG